MARRYYRRRTVTVRPKKKWASNLKIIDETKTGSSFTTILCTNSAQSDSPTPVILKTGNFKVRLDSQVALGSSTELWPALNFYVVYVPEGFVFDASPQPDDINAFVTRHPEWIICSGVAGSNTATGNKFDLETVSFSSRLKRNLNSGDKVLMLCTAPYGTSLSGVRVRGLVKFWTCAN